MTNGKLPPIFLLHPFWSVFQKHRVLLKNTWWHAFSFPKYQSSTKQNQACFVNDDADLSIVFFGSLTTLAAMNQNSSGFEIGYIVPGSLFQEWNYEVWYLVIPCFYAIFSTLRIGWILKQMLRNFQSSWTSIFHCLVHYVYARYEVKGFILLETTVTVSFTIFKKWAFWLQIIGPMNTSVRQTNSASSNLSLNIQGHVEVPKSKFFLKKIMSVSCNQPLYVKI